MAGISWGVINLLGRRISLTKWLGSLPEAKARGVELSHNDMV